MGTILKKNFQNSHHGHGERHDHHYVEMHGLLSYDHMLFMFLLAVTAVICQSFVGSKVVREKLIIIKGLGVQLESQNLQGGVSKRFIDISRVRDIVINEVRTNNRSRTTFQTLLFVCAVI